MKNLSFAVALFCCSQAALAADTCMFLNGLTMSVVANGYRAVTGKINFFPNTQSFTSTITFKGQAPDTIAGTCKNGHLTFTRAHSGPGGYVQTYDGSATDFTQEIIKGSYSNGSIDHSWTGLVLWDFSSSTDNSTPSSLTPAQIAACQQSCFNDLAKEKPGGTGVLVCNKPCQDCKSKCH